MEINVIGHIQSDFPSKFGVPRQSGLAPGLKGRIIFEKKYSLPDAFRELDKFSHIWVVWGFSEASPEWSPTVRPPRLGGNKRVGVFASRSPFRPNRIGLSAVKLDRISLDSGRIILDISGIDMTDGTPVYDIKPYLPAADSLPQAAAGYSDERRCALKVICPDELLERLPLDKRPALLNVLEADPRPQYHGDGRPYGFVFAGYEIKFSVEDNVLTVCDVQTVK